MLTLLLSGLVATINGGCVDDPNGLLAAAAPGFSCVEVATYGCGSDLNAVNPAAPAGTLVSVLCPQTCGACDKTAPPSLPSNLSAPTTLPCGPGRYDSSPFDGDLDCLDCPAGSSCACGDEGPKLCSPGTYAEYGGHSQCTPCPSPLTSGAGSLTCSTCMAGYALVDSSADPADIFAAPARYCAPCLRPDVCPSDNTTVETLFVPPGHWRSDLSVAALAECGNFFSHRVSSHKCRDDPNGNLSAVGYSCADIVNLGCGTDLSTVSPLVPEGTLVSALCPESCGLCESLTKASGKGRCVGGYEAGEAGAGYCAHGFEGPECQLCSAPDHYLNEDGCVNCPQNSDYWPIYLVVSCYVLLCVAIWAYSVQSFRELPCIGPAIRFADRVVKALVAIGLLPKLKIAMSFYLNVLGLIRLGGMVRGSSYFQGIFIPAPFEDLTGLFVFNAGLRCMQGISALASLVFFSDWLWLIPSQCAAYSTRLAATGFVPVGLIVLLLAGGIVLRASRLRYLPTPRPKLWPTQVTLGLLDMTPLCLFLGFFVIPWVYPQFFLSWSCWPAMVHASPVLMVDLDTSDTSALGTDAAVECGSDEHTSIKNLSTFLAIFWLLGSLILYTLLYVACYRPLRANAPTALTQATKFLHAEYTVGFFWWDMVDLMRKLIANAFILRVDAMETLLRIEICTLVHFVYLGLLAAAQPYRNFEDYLLAVSCNALLVVVYSHMQLWLLLELFDTIVPGVADMVVSWGRIIPTMLFSMMFFVAFVFVFISVVVGSFAAKRRRKRKRLERQMSEALNDAMLEMTGAQCTFVFVDADVIRSGKYEQTGATLPRLQEIEAAHPDWIHRHVLKRHLAYGRHAYRGNILAVSHRWEQPDAPDASGVQLRAIREHLQERPWVKFVWYDYWCLPQGERTIKEQVDFKRMLMNVNLLYIGCTVLILQELSYLSRFWTQFEAWCSMQSASEAGLRPASDAERRCTVVPILQATKGMASELVHMWASRSVDEAIETLASPDVTVTNQSDKELQLYKLRELDELVQEAVAQCARGDTVIDEEASMGIGFI